MGLKRFMLALVGAASLPLALAAGYASAAAVTEASEWYVEGAGFETLHGSEAVGCSVAEHNGAKALVLHGEVGSIAPKVPVTLTATGVECIGTTIFNDEKAGEEAATGTGKLKLTGVTIDEPANCKVVGGTIETELLHTEIYMDSENAAVTFDKFEPDATAGATRLAVVHIEEGGGCAISGNKVLKGFFYGQAENLTEVPAVTQPLTFDSSVEATAGNGLEFAGNSAHITGKVNNELVSGKEFEVKPQGTASEWYVEAAGIEQQTLHGSEPVRCSVGNHNGEGAKLVLHGEVGSIAPKVPITITATGVECIESSIFNDEKVGEQAATGTGRLEFTGVTISNPSTCKVVGGVIETEKVQTELYMDSENAAVTFAKFEPDAAAGATRFAVVHIEEAGGCAISGNKQLKGFFYGQAENLTGVEAVNQPLTFGESVEKTAGNGLTFAANSAHLTGTVNNELVSEAKFGARHP